ncbi:hypothetical protein WG904_08725 [Pedobacter sp. Du54]|uniref:hypothetical protein n=1 Tax=Pedobacter anseongensis TaxID=3133439 RepID=UPI0030B08AFE
MKAMLFKNWNFMRILRLAMGIFIITQGVLAKEWALGIMGGLFTFLAILNIGCCGTSACNTPNKSRKHQIEEISFEEVK